MHSVLLTYWEIDIYTYMFIYPLYMHTFIDLGKSVCSVYSFVVNFAMHI